MSKRVYSFTYHMNGNIMPQEIDYLPIINKLEQHGIILDKTYELTSKTLRLHLHGVIKFHRIPRIDKELKFYNFTFKIEKTTDWEGWLVYIHKDIKNQYESSQLCDATWFRYNYAF